MTVTVVGTGAASTATTAAIFPSWPTGHDVDDIGICFIETVGDVPASLSLARGFAFLGSCASAVSGALTRLDVFWCRATSNAMTSPNFTGQADHQYGIMVAFRGVTTTEAPTFVQGTGTNTLSTNPVSPAVTVPAVGSMVVPCLARGNDNAGGVIASISNANGATVTELWDFGTTAGDGGGIGIGTFLPASTGDSGVTNFTLGGNNAWATGTVLLKPGAASSNGRFISFFM